jgi:hypothetical protein
MTRKYHRGPLTAATRREKQKHSAYGRYQYRRLRNDRITHNNVTIGPNALPLVIKYFCQLATAMFDQRTLYADSLGNTFY